MKPGTVAEINRQKNALGDGGLRIELDRLRSALGIERSSFFTHWHDLGKFILPRRVRFYSTDVDKGNRRNMAIIDSTATKCVGTIQAGFMSGFTSSSRPWFRLTTQDPDLAKRESVKEWLYDVTWLMSDIFLRSNVYSSLNTLYGDLPVFATSAMLMEEDFDRVIHTYPMVIGSYYLFADDKLRVNGFMRDFRLTVRQIIDKFGREPGSNDINWSNMSGYVKRMWELGNSQIWVELSHAIIPNPDFDPNSPLADKKKYLSVYWERGALGNAYSAADLTENQVLSKRGYDRFRVMTPRWEIQGEDIYGTNCPGMVSLGDIQQLQNMERKGAQALEKSINPPMVGPATLRNSKATVLPGDITYLDTREGQQKFEPAYMIAPNFDQLEKKEEQIRGRIKSNFHTDLFLVISNLQKSNVTAEEIRALQMEKMQEIGPVVDRLNQDLLQPLIESTYEIMLAQRLIPPPPPEAKKAALRIEFVSIVHQAQKAMAAAGIERFWGFVAQVKTSDPENPSILDKVNTDEIIDHYGDALSVPPGIVRDDDDVKKMRAQRQKQQDAQQKLAAAEQASKTAKNLAGAPTDGQNALTDLIDRGQAGNLVPTP